jgi:cellulose biosynthesis protein BcsQ
MIIVVFNPKGGVGKSSISYQIAKRYNLPMFTNDLYNFVGDNDSTLQLTTLDEYEKEFPLQDGIYDFAGMPDRRISKVVKSANVVVVPSLLSYSDVKSTILTIDDISKYNRNIIVALNRIKPDDEKRVKEISESLREYAEFKDFTLLSISESKGVLNSINRGLSITELIQESPLMKRAYKRISNDFQKLFKVIDGD